MRFELELQAYCATQAQLDALQSDAAAIMTGNRIDVDQTGDVINRQIDFGAGNVMLLVSFPGTTRTGLDRMFNFIVNALEDPRRGVDTARSKMWLKQVGDNGHVNDQRDWPTPV